MASTERLIDIPAEHEKNVCGQMDSNLSRIERTLHVTMIERDGCLKIIGNEENVEKAASVFQNTPFPCPSTRGSTGSWRSTGT